MLLFVCRTVRLSNCIFVESAVCRTACKSDCVSDCLSAIRQTACERECSSDCLFVKSAVHRTAACKWGCLFTREIIFCLPETMSPSPSTSSRWSLAAATSCTTLVWPTTTPPCRSSRTHSESRLWHDRVKLRPNRWQGKKKSMLLSWVHFFLHFAM